MIVKNLYQAILIQDIIHHYQHDQVMFHGPLFKGEELTEFSLSDDGSEAQEEVWKVLELLHFQISSDENYVKAFIENKGKLHEKNDLPPTGNYPGK